MLNMITTYFPAMSAYTANGIMILKIKDLILNEQMIILNSICLYIHIYILHKLN